MKPQTAARLDQVLKYLTDNLPPMMAGYCTGMVQQGFPGDQVFQLAANLQSCVVANVMSPGWRDDLPEFSARD